MARRSSLVILIAITLALGLSGPVFARSAVSMEVPNAPAPSRERLLEAALPAIPAGFATVGVMRWTLQPSPRPFIVPPQDGPRLVLVEAGALVASELGKETRLAVGDLFVPTDVEGEVALHVHGDEEAIVVIVGFQGPDVTWCFSTQDPLAHTLQVLIYTPANRLPGGSGRLLLEQVTLPPGGRLAPYPASPYRWTSVGVGTLGLTLEGQMPFLWEAGQERRLGPGQPWPQIPEPIANPLMPSGTWLQMRNVGARPLVLYQLTLAPSTGEGLSADSPRVGSPLI
jgi:hypothetical protein